MRHERVNIVRIFVTASLIGLAGCGGLQPASVPVAKSETNLEDEHAGSTSAPVIDAAAANDTKVAAATEPQRAAVRTAQTRVDASRARSPGAGRNRGCVVNYVPKGTPNLLHLKLRRMDGDSPLLDDAGNPVVEETPELALFNWRSTGAPYTPIAAYWMYPEDDGEDQVPAQMYRIELAASSDPELAGVNGHNIWYAIEPSAEISAAIAEGTPMRIRFEDENGRNAFWSSETFGPNSNAIALASGDARWDIMATPQPDGTVAHDPVLVNPNDETRRRFLIRGAYEEANQEIE